MPEYQECPVCEGCWDEIAFYGTDEMKRLTNALRKHPSKANIATWTNATSPLSAKTTPDTPTRGSGE